MFFLSFLIFQPSFVVLFYTNHLFYDAVVDLSPPFATEIILFTAISEMIKLQCETKAGAEAKDWYMNSGIQVGFVCLVPAALIILIYFNKAPQPKEFYL
jgi:hypothetical protein